MRCLLPLCLLFALAGSAAASAPPVAVRLLASNPTPYVGEEVLLTLEIRTRQTPDRPLRPIWPAFDSASVEDLPFPPPQRGRDAAGSFLLQRVVRALVPLKSGALNINGAGVEDDAGRQEAAPLRLRVRPLPAAGRPDGFSGGVGRAELTLAGAGDGPREVLLSLRGHGALHQLAPPLPRLGTGEQLVLLSEERSGEAGDERVRSWRYLYLPGEGQVGKLNFELSLFDPLDARYRTLHVGVEKSMWPARVAAVAAALSAAALLWQYRRRRGAVTLEAALALWLGEPATGLPRRQLHNRLKEAGLEPALLAQLEAFWQRDNHRFAPGETPAAILPRSRQQLARALRRAWRKPIDKRRRIP